MTRWTSGVLASILLVAFCTILSGAPAQEWHTLPNLWKEPRRYHTPFETHFQDRIVITREPLRALSLPPVLSPNGAYWFALERDHEADPNNPWSYSVWKTEVPIYVFQERDYLIQILLRDRYPNFSIEVRWVNEKLLYVTVWWGRILGTSFLFDVEQEEIVYREMVNDGNLPYQQWQQLRR